MFTEQVNFVDKKRAGKNPSPNFGHINKGLICLINNIILK